MPVSGFLDIEVEAEATPASVPTNPSANTPVNTRQKPAKNTAQTAPQDLTKQLRQNNFNIKTFKKIAQIKTPKRTTRFYGMMRFADLAEFYVEQYEWENSMVRGVIVSNWARIVGEISARHTKPTFLDDGTLKIVCSSSDIAQELQYHTNQIRNNLRRFLLRVPPIVVKV
jgi:hypothetical protein